jgi:hypothetical protein
MPINRRVRMRAYATIREGNVRLLLDRPHWTPRRSFRSCSRCSVRLDRINPKHPMEAQTKASSRKRDEMDVENPRYRRIVVDPSSGFDVVSVAVDPVAYV